MGDISGFKRVLFCLWMLPALIFTWSCGGGGDGGQTPPPTTTTPAVIDQSTAEATEAIVRTFNDQMENSGPLIVQGPDASAPLPQSTALDMHGALLSGNGAIVKHMNNDPGVVRNGSITETLSCETSGTFTASGKWTGPDISNDADKERCEVRDSTWTFTISECVSRGVSYDADFDVYYGGSMCRPTEMLSSFRKLTRSDGENFLEAVALESQMTDLQWDDDQKSITGFVLTLDGDMAINDLSAEFDQFRMDVFKDDSVKTVSLNGALTGGCFDGWVTVTTLSPVRSRLDDACPFEGAVQFAGADDVVVDVVYNSDGSMDIGDRHYDACNAPALPSLCR